MKRYFLTSLLLSSVFTAHAINFEGDYECKGNEVGTNEEFTCKLNIAQTGETYASKATCSDGNAYRGTGIFDENTNCLSTVFINQKKAKETGVSVTTIKPDGNLINWWTYLDKNSIALTKCTKSSNQNS